jgi:hypothetical protein
LPEILRGKSTGLKTGHYTGKGKKATCRVEQRDRKVAAKLKR